MFLHLSVTKTNRNSISCNKRPHNRYLLLHSSHSDSRVFPHIEPCMSVYVFVQAWLRKQEGIQLQQAFSISRIPPEGAVLSVKVTFLQPT